MFQKKIRFKDLAIILENEEQENFLIRQEDEEIGIYVLDDNFVLYFLNRIKGCLYDDLPSSVSKYYQSRLHFVDKKNKRIILVITFECGQGKFCDFGIAGFDYKGKQLFFIPVNERIIPKRIEAFADGNLLIYGKFNRFLYSSEMSMSNYLLWVNVKENKIWKLERKCAQGENETGEKIYIKKGDWEDAYIFEDQVLLEIAEGYGKKRYSFVHKNGKFHKNLMPLERKIFNSTAKLFRDNGSLIIVNEKKGNYLEKYEFDSCGKCLNRKGMEARLTYPYFLDQNGILFLENEKRQLSLKTFDDTLIQLKEVPIEKIHDMRMMQKGSSFYFILYYNQKNDSFDLPDSILIKNIRNHVCFDHTFSPSGCDMEFVTDKSMIVGWIDLLKKETEILRVPINDEIM